MHILGILTTIAIAIFWISRAARGSRDIVDVASSLANLPRKRKFQKLHGKSGYALVETPIEAATVLMIAVARVDSLRGVSEAEIAAITLQLEQNMQLGTEAADGIYRQMYNLTHEIILPETALFPMVDILKNSIDRDDALQLARMMERVATCETIATTEQMEFIRRFKERMNLLH
eukprot:GHVR01193442.1.p1 GENE.GHVR01193442.1~~GHVR01193442.1.p1  ORF type:complete len:175 (+),score=10.23 GHVR01193442.1:164-688(+)